MAELAFLFELGLIVIAATFFNFVFRLLKQPPILAYIIAGVIIGPLGLGALNLSFQGIPIGVTTAEGVKIAAELGIAFLLFSIGVESDFTRMRGLARVVTMGAILRLLVVGGVVIWLTAMYTNLLGFKEALYLGAILAFSSTALVVKILADKHELNTLHARLMIGFLIVEDLLVILLLPLLANTEHIFMPEHLVQMLMPAVGIILLAFLLNKFFYPPFFRFAAKSEELLFLAALSSCFIFIGIAYMLNFSIAVGSFIAGLALSTLPYNLEVYDKIRGIRDFFVTVFFVSLGMQLNFEFFNVPTNLLAIILAVSFILKPLVYYLLSVLEGFGNRISTSVALGLSSISEFAFIMAGLGLTLGHIGKPLYSLVIFIVSVSMALSPYFIQSADGVYKVMDGFVAKHLKFLKKSRLLHRKLKKYEHLAEGMSHHVVIFGGGTMGRNIAEGLHGKMQFVVVDQDPEVIRHNIAKGVYSIYGSADNREIWDKAGLQHAKAVVLALPDAKSAIAITKHVKEINKEAAVFARAHYYKDALHLYKAGADFVVMQHVIASNMCLEKLMEFMLEGKAGKVFPLTDEYFGYLARKVEEEKGNLVG